jgi:hypothetical protein
VDKRTTGIIATVAAVLLCGCPGLFALFMGALFTVISPVPGAQIDIGGRTDPRAALGTGIGLLCLGALFLAIPVVVGFLTLRNRPAPAAVTGGAAIYTPPASTPPVDLTPPSSTPSDEELPPTS